MTKLTIKAARQKTARLLVRIRQRVPPGGRLVLGLLLMAGGVVGFLPIVGFWMIPLGVAVAALDIKPVYRWIAKKLRK
ncbi:MAG: hypothetical protein WBN04_13190 [Paracoccaceae bacterium]